MRSTTAGELTTLGLLTRTVTYRVKIANGSGTMIDLSSWLMEPERNEDIDQPVASLKLQFIRADGVLKTLSPLRTDSTLNRLDDGVTYGPLIDLVRPITIEVATTPVGVLPSGSDFKLKFDGTTQTINIAGNPIVVDCLDKGRTLVRRWVEAPRAYGSGPGVALETVMQSIHDDELGAGVMPVFTPVSPSYLISPVYQQQIEPIMDADVALAQLPGFDVREKWDDGSAAFRFTLYRPDRTKTVPDFTFGPDRYFDVTQLELSELDVRNVIIVSFKDSADFGNRKTITVFDSASITKFGRSVLFITESDTSPINTVAEATTMANAALADLKDPKAEFEVSMPLFWPAELGDLYRFTSNGVHFNENQDWAVVSITDGLHDTRLKLRGSPAGQYLTWLKRGGTIGGGGGAAFPPVPQIIWKNTEVDESVWRFRFAVLNGSGGGGANISYLITTKRASAAESTISSGSGTALPIDIDITRDPQVDKVVRFKVTDAATGLTAEDRITVPSIRDEVTTTGAPKRGKPFDDGFYTPPSTTSNGDTVHGGVKESGGKTINRLFAKPLLSDPDNLDSVPDATVYKRILSVVSGQATTPSIASLAVTDAKINDMAAGKNTAGTLVSGILESGGKAVNRLFAKALLSSPDDHDSVVTGVVNRSIPLTVFTANNDLNARKVVGTGSTPSGAAGAGLGTGGAAGVTISGTDTAGKINFTQGASGFASGEKAVITFVVPYGTAPFILLTHDNSASTTFYPFGPTSITTAGFAISSPLAGLAGDQHAFWYHVLA